jgi:hypothetical protein
MANDEEQAGAGAETVTLYADLNVPLTDPGELTDLLSQTRTRSDREVYGSQSVLSVLSVPLDRAPRLIAGLNRLGVPYQLDSGTGAESASTPPRSTNFPHAVAGLPQPTPETSS